MTDSQDLTQVVGPNVCHCHKPVCCRITHNPAEKGEDYSDSLNGRYWLGISRLPCPLNQLVSLKEVRMSSVHPPSWYNQNSQKDSCASVPKVNLLRVSEKHNLSCKVPAAHILSSHKTFLPLPWCPAPDREPPPPQRWSSGPWQERVKVLGTPGLFPHENGMWRGESWGDSGCPVLSMAIVAEQSDQEQNSRR